MKQTLLLNVRDKSGREWGFIINEDPAHIAEWREAGLEVYEVEATIPAWVVSLGLTGPWSAVQAAWRWLRMW